MRNMLERLHRPVRLGRYAWLSVVLCGGGLLYALVAGAVLHRPPGDLETELGGQRLEDGRHAQALAYFEAALQRAPEHQGARMGKALVFMQTARPHQALAALDTLIARLEERPEAKDATGRAVLGAAYANRGMVRDSMGRHRAALRDYLHALHTDAEAVSGPGLVHKLLHGGEGLSTVRDRAGYLYQQLQLPAAERILRIPELDARQPMYKP